jgi:flagellin-like protein
MKRLLKSKKALSPVVAAIILIAVTVAVSIAVAAWMGALTFTFMKTEELRITSVTFTNLSTPVIACTNTGADTLTVTSVTVDDVAQASTDLTWGGQFDATAHSLDKGESGTITIALSSALTSGAKYTFAVLTSAGNKYTYTTTAAP